MQKNDSSQTKTNHDRVAAIQNIVNDLIPEEWRLKALQFAHGRVLEVGVGSGFNLPLYTAACSEVVGIDPSLGMLHKAARRVNKARVPIFLYEMDVQALEFSAASFDTVVATCVFGAVPDPLKGLKEISRVCRPDGTIILVEYMRSSHGWLGKIMDWMNPVTVWLLGNHINHPTIPLVLQAGIEIREVENLFGDVVKLIVGQPVNSFQVSCVTHLQR